MISTSMKQNESIYHRQAGGGGWGSPLCRLPQSVQRDVINDKVSIRAARADYGVIIKEDTLEIDESRTKELRKKREKTKDR